MKMELVLRLKTSGLMTESDFLTRANLLIPYILRKIKYLKLRDFLLFDFACDGAGSSASQRTTDSSSLK